MARAYDAAHEVDAAWSHYEHVVTAPRLTGLSQQDRRVWQGYLGLGELYEQRGDGEKAVEYYNKFVELWTEADPELQPRVREVRARIARLVSEG